MEEIKQAVLKLLRSGINIADIQLSLVRVADELKTTTSYLKAIDESNKAP